VVSKYIRVQKPSKLQDKFSAEMPVLNGDSTLRIINGEPIHLKYQLQMRLKSDGSHQCGAVLISPSFALTAHHCFGRFGEKTRVLDK